MRIRFKPWARPELEASDFYRDNPEELKDKWIKEFKNQNNPINLSGENKLRPISTAFILEKDGEDLGDKTCILDKLK